MNVVVTGGAGFIGSHVAEFYANQGNNVTVIDNLSRFELLKKQTADPSMNWTFLKGLKNVNPVKADIRDFDELKKLIKGADTIIHAAAQTAVTTSMTNPAEDFSANAVGTFNVLEAARVNDVSCVAFTSTNKVYGDNVNNVPLIESEKRYSFDEANKAGIPEDFSIDLNKHTPYGCSKLTGDLYAQDYSYLYGIRTGVFRMSCIYGTRQFGLEDQGWVAWFIIASLLNKKITLYGDGKQVRDVLYVTDLVGLFDSFITSNKKHLVLNAGGGPENTLSLLEFLDILEKEFNKKIDVGYDDWRPSDQKVYISDIKKAEKELNWKPKVSPEEGIKKLIEWVKENKALFA